MAVEVLKPGDVASPCINFCRMDYGRGVCLGCFRTLDEIVHWAEYTPRKKRAVLAKLPARREPR
jgi:predicted Fe-S protein YdhL (DUF1289 family)